MLDRFRIVLLEPSGPANIGAICRVMFNMGLSDLCLVAPRCDLANPEAVSHATHGRQVLAQARVVASIPGALRDCVQSYVTTAKLGLYRRQSAATAHESAQQAVAAAARGPVAIAFGREDRGVLTSELLHFDRVITIPAAPQHPVLNLAAAATIVCYELRRAALAAANQPELPLAIQAPPAVGEHKDALFAALFDALERIDFFRGQSPEHLRYILRQVFGRIDLSVVESDVLIGVARQIQYYVRTHGHERPVSSELNEARKP